MSLPEALLSWKTLLSSPRSFPVKSLGEKLQRLNQLTPYKGCLVVQLANNMKQDDAEILPLKEVRE